jgi:hypothetical protein
MVRCKRIRLVLPVLALALAVAALALGGCGGDSGDLMAIEVSGGVAGQPGGLEMVVANDGRGSCNGGPEELLPSDLVIDAREAERELGDLAAEGAAYGPSGNDQREYKVRIKAGTVRWAEGEPGLPKVLPETQLLALRLDRVLCRG